MKKMRAFRRSVLVSATASMLAVAPLGCNGGMKQITGCQSDAECTNGQVCRASDGLCVDPPKQIPFEVVKIGAGSGTITSSPAGIDCGQTCNGVTFPVGSPVTLTATPANGYVFAGFSGGCNSTTPTCVFTPQDTDDLIHVVANFALPTPTVAAALCNSASFCWENPKPIGNRLNRALSVATGDVWAVGDAGTIVHRSGTSFSLVTSNTTRDLRSIWGTANDLYAVGQVGTILHNTGSGFVAESSPLSTDLFDVWGSGGSVVAVGALGTVIRRTGTTWSADTSNTGNDLLGVAGSGSTDVWAVAAGGVVDHYNGGTWMSSTPGVFSGFDVRAVAAGSGTFYAVDSFGDIYNYGTSWTKINNNPNDDLWGVAVISGTAYAVGQNVGGTVLHYTGTAWQRDATAVDNFRSITGFGSTDLWAVGDSGTFWASSSGPWQPKSSGVTVSMNGVWASDAQNAWAVGGAGAVLHYNGSYFSPVSVGTSVALNGVAGTSASDVWAVGGSGTILHYNGTSWSNSSSGTARDLRAVFALSSSRAWAVGESGTVLTWDGSNWTTVTTSTTGSLRGIWASSASDVWAVGELGITQHSTGGSFTAATPSPSTSFTIGGIWGSGASDIWVAADTVLFHYQGASWASVNPGSSAAGLGGIWGSAANDIYATGKIGTLMHYDGSSWSKIPTGAAPDLAATMVSQRKLWVVGGSGTVLRKDL